MVIAMAVRPEPYRFTVDDYHRMAEVGLLAEDERVELIGGEIIAMAPIGSRHAACVNRLTRLLSSAVGEDVIVAVQNPVRLDAHTEVQPDIALLRARKDFYADSYPEPNDVLLIVEVAETSMTYDRTVKLGLYGGAAITEVWLVDLSADRVAVHRAPTSHGYQEVSQLEAGDHLSSATLPHLELEASAILGS
jgi:Uma2 family endonuclease